VAVVGLACRFPGARDYREFWANLRSGTESVTFFTDDELASAGVPPERSADPDYVGAQGVVDGADEFDAEFFGVSPSEARLIDPQHRVLLESAWAALEDAGYDPSSVGKRFSVGVFAGAYKNDHAALVPPTDDPAARFLNGVAADVDYLATRVSFKLGLTGPSVSVQTACSTSLVAVHLACESLLSGSCDLALAGGVTLRSGQLPGYLVHRGGIYSPDGHCRAFDERAEGTVIGEGVGLVVLKRLEDALAEGDDVRAVVLGSAVGNDGADRVGFSAPGVAGQARIVRAALRRAGAGPDTIQYVETHGSGTPLGDRIEIDALARAFEGRTRGEPVAIGSVKTNIGHTHAAAGIAGLIKTVGALRGRVFPPSLHFTRPNPRIDFEGAGFRVNAEAAPWPSAGSPRRAGVSSFGLGGTGAHVVLEEAPPVPPRPEDPSWQALTLSAREPAALEAATDRLAERLGEPVDLADAAWTLHTGRPRFGHRRLVVARDAADAAEALRSRDPSRVFDGQAPEGERRVAFLLPGLGEQYEGMGRELYDGEPVFRRELDRCLELLRTEAGIDLRPVLFAAEPADRPEVDLRAMLGRAAPSSELDRTCHAQPAIFAVEYALAKLWMSWGVRPDALLGYSIGEYVAACLAGVLSLEDALVLVAERARLIDGLPGGAMLAVQLPERDVAGLLGAGLSLAAVNGDDLCVVAGPGDAVVALRERLTADGAGVRPLRTTHAFHSAMMRPLAAELDKLAAGFRARPPSIPYLSNVTGDWITDADATDPGYWTRHLCRPVRFADGVERLWRTPGRILLEVGPGQSLGSLALPARPDGTGGLVLASMPPAYLRQPGRSFLLTTAGKLWLSGVDVDWAAVHSGRRRRVPLPTYPFRRDRYSLSDGARPRAGTGGLVKKADLSGWFHVPSWEPGPVLGNRQAAAPPKSRWLLFADASGLAAELTAVLTGRGEDVVRVEAGEEFAELSPGRYAVRADSEDDYAALLRAIGGPPAKIVHLWLVGPRPADPYAPDVVEETSRRGFRSLLCLAKAVGGQQAGEHVDVSVISSDLHALGDAAAAQPAKATVLGPCRVWPQENPAVTCRSIDVSLAELAGPRLRRSAAGLLAELDDAGPDRVTAQRGGRRWRQVFRPVALEEPAGTPWLRPGGVYLITGGLGGIGVALAEHFARVAGAKLVLVSRSALPPRDRWQAVLAGTDAEARRRVRAVQRIEAAGGEVLVCAADVTDAAGMREVFAEAAARFGAVHGVVHAAGVPGAGLIQLKDLAKADAVLAPKVRGTLALRQACGPAEPDFVVLCSSGLAVTGGAGQVDYCGANAFLDAFAHREAAVGGPLVVSVNWDAWRGDGMAARMIAPAVREVGHPLIEGCLVDGEDYALYTARVDAAGSWLVDEHRMLGRPVVPGVAHLELVRAAFADRHGEGPVEFRQVTFASPIVLAEDEHKEIRVELRADGGRTRFTVAARSAEAEAAWQLHSSGFVGRAEPGPRRRLDVSGTHLRDLGRPEHDGPMGFGARSRCLRRMYAGDREFLARIELPAEFGGELAGLPLHPALMDISTAFVGLHTAEEFRIPLSYGRVLVSAPLTAAVFSHHRYAVADRAGAQTVTADVVITGADGVELVRIEDFVLKKVDDLGTRLATAQEGRSGELAFHTFPPVPGVPGFLRDNLDQGMDPDEGVRVFGRIVGAGLAPQVLVTTKDFDSVVAQVEQGTGAPPASPPATPSSRAGHPRPALLTAYVEPRDDTERALAALWQDLLGIDRVGVHDSFFELGGHSLLGLQLLTRLRAAYEVDLPVGTFFDALTVARQATVVAGAVAAGRHS
jgi:acyl transferase domain-containing protein